MLDVDIYKDFGSFKLDIAFTSSDQVVGILGPSGSGKSLTLKCLAGIIKPDRGRIVINDRVVFDSKKNINLKAQDRRIGYFFQDYALFPNMSVYDNIRAGIRDKKANHKAIINKKLEELGLSHIRNKKPSEISGGEKQRTALARILVNDADLLLLDEPYSAIDEYLRWKIEVDIKETIEKYKIPTLFVSHNMDEVYRMCDSLVTINKGKGEAIKKTKDLFTNPETLSAAEISGCRNFSRIEEVEEGKYRACDWGIDLDIGAYRKSDFLGIRSHSIRIVEENSRENTYPLDLIKEIEEIYKYSLIVRPKNSNHQGSLRVDIDKDEWNRLKGKENLYFHIDEKDLLYLKK